LTFTCEVSLCGFCLATRLCTMSVHDCPRGLTLTFCARSVARLTCFGRESRCAWTMTGFTMSAISIYCDNGCRDMATTVACGLGLMLRITTPRCQRSIVDDHVSGFRLNLVSRLSPRCGVWLACGRETRCVRTMKCFTTSALSTYCQNGRCGLRFMLSLHFVLSVLL
jgi:hypothetical protein